MRSQVVGLHVIAALRVYHVTRDEPGRVETPVRKTTKMNAKRVKRVENELRTSPDDFVVECVPRSSRVM